MILHLIRHGQTLANQQRLYCGATDVPLTEEGLQAIKSLAAQGIYPALDGLAVYTSGLLRTRQTLEAIYGPVPHGTLPGFQEMHFGAFEMKSYEQLKNDPAYIAWIEDQSGEVSCPGGESSQIFTRRVISAFESLKNKNQSSLVICHGGVIATLMQHLFPQEPLHFYQWQPKPGQGYTLFLPERNACRFLKIPIPAQSKQPHPPC
ncbi:MAG: histidine phosphatase family protein [Christensenellales bacterium]|jgi:alpha-ribazole phosphatase